MISMNNFEYYNPNPTYMPMKNGKNKSWHNDDWPVRALCAATGFTWDMSFKHLMKYALKNKDLPSSKNVMNDALIPLGFKFVTCGRPKTGEHRLTVSEFCDKYKDNICICNIPGSFVACVNGKYMNTDDCGDTVVYSYWIKEN